MKKIFTLLLTLVSLISFSQSTTVVISQFYGSGGNTSAVYTADYVELHNVSTVSQSLAGLSIQYAAAASPAGTDWTGISPLPAVSIPAGGYFLIQMSTPGAVGIAIPTADYIAVPTIAMGGSNGKVALVNGITPINNCTATNIIDLVGYGTANCAENTPTAALSSANGGFRNNSGCTDTNNNSTDFTVAPPLPRNSATPVFICTGTPPGPALTAGTVTDFGNVVVLTNSTSQSFSLSGSNLTGAPGVITITAPSTDFQVSNNNTTWGPSTTIPYTSATLASTLVYVRFTPQSVGLKTGNITITGGGTTTAVLVPVRGTGVSGTTATLSPGTLTSFGNVCVNTDGGPESFTLSGTNLTAANITVGPLAGYTFSTTSGGTYTSTLTLTQGGGTYSQTVFVTFSPTAVQSYNGNIPVTGGGATATNVAATGAGVNGTPTVTTGSASAITFTSATLGGSIGAAGCSVVSSYGIAYSTTSGFTTGTQVVSTNISGGSFTSAVSGLLPGTTYYYKAFATNAGGTAYGAELSFITGSAGSPVLTATELAPFTVCAGGTSAPNLFTLSSTNLSSTDITVGPLSGFTFSTTETGTYSPTLTITQGGGSFNQDVYVQFSPATSGIFNGSVPVSGGGAGAISVNVIASSENVPVSLTTGPVAPVLLTPTAARLSGEINDPGCSEITEYGIVYSGISGFPESMGIKATSDNINAGVFTVDLSSLAPATTYFYKAYTISAAGKSYGQEENFKTGEIPGGFVLYSNPVIRGGNIHISVSNIVPGHYGLSFYNMAGQRVFRKDFVVQLNFLDEIFNLPGTLGKGVYIMQLEGYDGFKNTKSFIIQ